MVKEEKLLTFSGSAEVGVYESWYIFAAFEDQFRLHKFNRYNFIAY
jgi:hypothetical protein